MRGARTLTFFQHLLYIAGPKAAQERPAQASPGQFHFHAPAAAGLDTFGFLRSCWECHEPLNTSNDELMPVDKKWRNGNLERGVLAIGVVVRSIVQNGQSECTMLRNCKP